MISSSQVHILTILSNIFNSFPGNVLATKAKSSESDCCPFAACCRNMGRERKMKSVTCPLATMYISTRLFVCKKKCPSLPGICTSDTSCQPLWNMAITTLARIENASELKLLVLSILVRSLVATLLAG